MKSINELLLKIKNKKLLIIFPHPDDESIAAGGLILSAKRLGYEVTLLTLTKGGAGRININPKGRSLKEIRSAELEKASKILGIDNLIIKDFDDGKLKTRNGWNETVKENLLRIKPAVVVTYDPTGISGHPDHINLSVGVKRIINELLIARKTILFWVTLDGQSKNLVTSSVRRYLTNANYELTMTYSIILSKLKAMFCHKSQRYDKLSEIILRMITTRKEWYHKVDMKKDYPYKYINFNI